MIQNMMLCPSISLHKSLHCRAASRAGLIAALLVLLNACSSILQPPPAGSSQVSLGDSLHPRSRWVASSWAALPGWSADTVTQVWPLLLRSCQRPNPVWIDACQSALRTSPSTDDEVRQWFENQLQPYLVQDPEGGAKGLLTGYFEPLMEARRVRGGGFDTPIYALPADLNSRTPYWSREQIDTVDAARASLKGHEIAFVRDPLDALLVQIQGSGRIRLLDEHDAEGRPKLLRLSYAGNNGHPYQSIGKWLVQHGELTADQANWPAIKEWARTHPQRVPELLRVNPRMVFFKEQAMDSADGEAAAGPVGAQGLALTPRRSIAVDTRSIPLGTPVWIVSTLPQAWSDKTKAAIPQALQHLVLAQDTGNAITGAVRADYFWGSGEVAEWQAGRTKQPLLMWVLWPKSATP